MLKLILIISTCIIGLCACRKTNAPINSDDLIAETAEYIVNENNIISTNFSGFGTQYNQNVYSSFSAIDGIFTDNINQLEAKVKALNSQYVRIFFDSKAWPFDPKYTETIHADFMDSFIKTVKLAQDAGAKTINITFWHTSEAAKMSEFANVLHNLIVNHELTAVNEVTIQNEVNLTKITFEEYKSFYIALDQSLKSLGIRDRIKFVGGDLVQNNQNLWYDFMAKNMNSLLDGYSSHVYWNDNETSKPIQRLTDISNIVKGLGTGRKPVYITEYGVRGGNRPTGVPQPGYLTGSTIPISETNESALQNALFQINGLNLGFSGYIRWDCFKAKYDNGIQFFSCIGSGTDGYPLYPLYYMTWLFTHTSLPGWNVVETKQGKNINKVVATMKEPNGNNMTVYALNNSNSKLSYTIGGLPPNKSFRQVSWNDKNDGKVYLLDNITSDKEGNLKLDIQSNSMIALTTLNVMNNQLPN